MEPGLYIALVSGQQKISKRKQARPEFVRMEHIVVGSNARGVEPNKSPVSQKIPPRGQPVGEMAGGDVSEVRQHLRQQYRMIIDQPKY